jgi:uncharacterized protein YecE (DUF72 family)
VTQVRIGCSGWVYPHWRGTVYPTEVPERRWLEHYAGIFDTVEVNATFYRLPRPSTAAAWVERTPPGFVFAVKASRYLTHVKRLADPGPGMQRFLACIEPLAGSGKLGPLLWQLPETFRRDDERLAGALAALPPGRHAFEFRHASWFVPEVAALLKSHGVALVIGDNPRRPFQTRSLTAGFTFVRFHYGRGRNGNYSRRQLDEWAEWIGDVRRRVDVYAYFNNDWEGFAVANASGLVRRLER